MSIVTKRRITERLIPRSGYLDPQVFDISTPGQVTIKDPFIVEALQEAVHVAMHDTTVYGCSITVGGWITIE
jgi:hypothetical protein